MDTTSLITLIGIISLAVGGVLGFLLKVIFFQNVGDVKHAEKDNIKQENEIIRLQEQLKFLKEKLEKIETNDLFHLKQSLDNHIIENNKMMILLIAIASKEGVDVTSYIK